MTKISNSQIINNVFYTNAQNQFMFVENISPQTNNVINYNSWYTPNNNANSISVDWRGTNYGTFANYKSGAGQEANSFYGNPSFVSTSSPDLHITPASNCVDAGDPTTVITAGETDYDGNTRIYGARVDCGAYEANFLGMPPNLNPQNYLSVYPNPANKYVFLKTTAEGEVLIYNLLGEVKLRDNSSKNILQIDVSILPAGVYSLFFKGAYCKFVKE